MNEKKKNQGFIDVEISTTQAAHWLYCEMARLGRGTEVYYKDLKAWRKTSHTLMDNNTMQQHLVSATVTEALPHLRLCHGDVTMEISLTPSEH